MQYDVIIIGAGAAGLMCAATAGKRGRNVLLLDHAKTVGEKIRISGGGRCNFTNTHASPANYLSGNPRFCISALKRYTQMDFIRLVERYNIAYHEKTLGQLFCDGSSQQIIDMLVAECDAAGVTVAVKSSVKYVEKSEQGFTVQLVSGESHMTQSLVIATGGPSIPKMGATGWAYEIARQFGLKVVEPRAALVPFTLDGRTLSKLQPLSGVSVDVIVTCNRVSFKEALLFTHRGISGPAILQISSYWKEGDALKIDLVPDRDALSVLKEFRSNNPRQEVATALAALLPKRLAQYIGEEYGYVGKMADMSNKRLEEMVDRLKNWHVLPDGTEGFRTAEVTIGGVDTDELSSKSFEARRVSGLYFIGEAVDVTGHLGGFNFQWAWSSGAAAGGFV